MSNMVETTTEAAVIVDARRRAFRTGATRPLEWRIAQLDALDAMLRENSEQLQAALKQDLNKPGMKQNTIYGRSSNQEMLNVPAGTEVEPDDFVFLRPTQTEAVLMQFGALAVYDGEVLAGTWAPMPPSA